MANANDIIGGGEFLKAADLQGKRHVVVISEWDVQDSFGSKQIVLSFEGKTKKLGLNKTNTRMIIELLGTSETDDWIGKAITLRPDKTQNKEGAIVDCIRVDFELPEQPARVASQASGFPTHTGGYQPGDGGGQEDNIPF